VAVLCLLAIAPAATAQRPAVSFDPAEPLEVTWDDLAKRTPVEVVNETTGPLKLTVLATTFRGPGRIRAPRLVGFLGPDTPSSAGRPPFPIEITIRAAESKVVTLLRIERPTPPSGVYRSSIVAFAPGGQALARRSIVLTVPPVPQAAPLVDEVTFKSFRWRVLPWGHPRPKDLELPLEPLDANAPTEKRLGAIASGSTFATVSYDTVRYDKANVDDEEDQKKLVALGLTFEGLEDAGEYEGTLDLLPGSDEGEVTLKLIHSDAIWVPLLVLFLGLLVGNWIGKQVGVVVRYLDLKARVARLGEALEAAQNAFAKESAGKSWAAYGIAPAVAAERRDLDTHVDDLRAAHTQQIPDKKAEEVIAKIDAVRGRIKPFGPFGHKLATLDGLRTNIVDAPPEPLQRGDWAALEAAIVTECDTVLRPTPDRVALGSLEAFETLNGKADKLSAGASAWLRRQSRLAYAQTRLNELRAPNGNPCKNTLEDDVEPGFRAAQDLLCDVYRDLWQQATAEDAASDVYAERVNAVVVAVDALLPEQAEKAAAPEPPVTVGGGRPLGDPTPPEAGEGDWKETRRRYLDAARRRWIALWVLATVLALATGLNTLYFDKPFGGWWDYIALFLWGVSSKFIVDLVAKGLDAVGLGGLRAPSSS
jgi:hypothetical protein